jgi:hypothetical protein
MLLLKATENSLTIKILKVTIIRTLVRYFNFPSAVEKQEIINATNDKKIPKIDIAPGTKLGNADNTANNIEKTPITTRYSLNVYIQPSEICLSLVALGLVIKTYG